jgi:Transposase DDE domain
MTIVTQILKRIEGIRKPQRKFLLSLFAAILATHSKINFLNLSRHSSLNEKTYRRGFRRQFDFVSFNREAIKNAIAQESQKAFVQDASFSKKRGKKTFGLDKFWNGCASRSEKGLEVSMISIVDLSCNQSFALSVEQTPSLVDLKQKEKEQTRMDFYLQHLQTTAGNFPKDVKIGLFDGFYAKLKFINGVKKLGFEVISKLRCDANLKYLYEGEQKKRGRKRKYDGKVDFQELSRFEKLETDDQAVTLYTLLVWSVSLKRQIRVVVVVKLKEQKKMRYVVLFSTDPELSAKLIFEYYKARFSIEFIFRDAKQFAGFSDCQARDPEALHFHFNASVSSVNLARLLAQEEQKGREKFVFSMSSMKQRWFNDHLLELFISRLELDQTAIKSHPQFETLRNYAAIAT